ncbi:hypothetical protein QAD02_016886 [Eretmocerus hayati]|uniref:Uncharacterized protein n=1 Tax=Eretmocerus hayati TaxID=131215 RepID=A0ACC2PBU6_9HYME|nr:hypothetical protein QAD02_016886 [Eretmocerus hayati]
MRTRISTPVAMHTLYHRLMAEGNMGVSLPQCIWRYFRGGKLFDGLMFAHDTFSWNSAIRKVNGGKFFNEFITNVKQMKVDKMEKLFLYSAHEDMLVALMKILNIFKPHVPGYSNALVFEVHKGNNIDYIKIFHQSPSDDQLEEDLRL